MTDNLTNHSYEEIRSAAMQSLCKATNDAQRPKNYDALKQGVAYILSSGERELGATQHTTHELSHDDSQTFLEVFWDLFRQGIISLGASDTRREFPYFRVTGLGQNILGNRNAYFFHDVTSYTRLLEKEVPQINETTLLYAQEAMQAFQSGCILSSSVMLGVATEHTFLLMMETVNSNPQHAPIFAAVEKERLLLLKVNKFKRILDNHHSLLSRPTREDLDTQFTGILAIIRNFRNESGHPSGKIIDREQAYVLLHLFLTYSKKLYQLMDDLK